MPLMSLGYFPPLSWFAAYAAAPETVLDRHESFQKQSYHNRCHILTSQGVQRLVVPVQHGGDRSLAEATVDTSQPWARTHLRTLQAAYGKAPYFEHYAPQLFGLLEQPQTSLWQLNVDMLTFCLQSLHLPVCHTFSERYLPPQEAETDLRGGWHPKKGHPAADQCQLSPYVQCFGSNFTADLCVLDGLFNLGPTLPSHWRWKDSGKKEQTRS